MRFFKINVAGQNCTSRNAASIVKTDSFHIVVVQLAKQKIRHELKMANKQLCFLLFKIIFQIMMEYSKMSKHPNTLQTKLIYIWRRDFSAPDQPDNSIVWTVI